MPDPADWIESHSAWTRVLTLFAAFASAPAIGWLISETAYAGSVFVSAAGAAALILTLGIGYKIWAAYIASSMVRRFFGGFLTAALKSIVSRDSAHATDAMQTLRDRLGDRESVVQMVEAFRVRTRIFRRLGPVFGLVAGIAVGTFDQSQAFWASLVLFALIGTAYGAVMSHLAHEGLLPLPVETN